MAVRRRRMNPRNSKGRFIKKKTHTRRRRRARKNPIANPRRRRRRHARKNPARVVHRRRRRRVRHNPARIVHRRRRRRVRHNPARIVHRRRRRRVRRNPSTALARNSKGRFVKRSTHRRRHKRTSLARRKLYRKVSTLRRRALKMRKRSVKRAVAMAQWRRASAIRKAITKGKRRAAGPLVRAMHLKTNPGGISGLLRDAKVLAPQVGAGAASMVGCAMGGVKLSDMITKDKTGALKASFIDANGAPKKLAVYMPAISTAGIAVVGYGVANKVLPKYKGAILIGGLLGAVVQAIVASVQPDKPDSVAAKVKKALGLGDYTLVGGLADYTTVGALGQRMYADSGMFRNVGGLADYTLIGGGADNATEFAADSLRGMDDATEFAPGEGGVLSGGMFRGPSSR